MPDKPSRVLEQADSYAADGDLLDALNHYKKYVSLEGEPDQTWYALYQAARMLDELDFNSQLIAEAYLDAYDFHPENIEPLIRIARRCRQAGQLQAALDLINVALETEPPDYEHLHEPEAWLVERGVEYMRICLAMNDYDQAIKMADQLLVSGQLPIVPQKLVNALRLQALNLASSITSSVRQEDGALKDQSSSSPQTPNDQPSVISGTIPAATPRGEKRKLCIGMATFDDYDGVYFSVQAIRMYHPEVLDQVEILVIDNNPTGLAAEKLKELDTHISNYRYVPESKVVGTAIRDLIFREANADYVLVMDCHVFLVPGAIRQLIEYLNAHPDTQDLLQGPLLNDDLKTVSTHLAPGWNGGMWGTWSTDPRGEPIDADPFEIPMQGCGLFACRRTAWPGFNASFRGFGGEEGYIQEKVRQAGGHTLCLPFLRWMHRFNRPLGVPYSIVWEDRIRNYIIGWQELGLDVESIKTHFSELIGEQETDLVFDQVARENLQP